RPAGPARYRWVWARSRAVVVELAIQPQGGDTTAVVEGEVWGVVLHIWLPGTGDHPRKQIHIVLLLRRIALKVDQDLLAHLWVLGSSLLLQHGHQLGVVDMAAVPP